MDPTTALDNARTLCSTILAMADKADVLDFASSFELGLAVELCETFQGLDRWLRSGGHLPEGWQR